MATADKTLVSLANLETAVGKIKTYVDTKDGLAYKNIALDPKTDTVYFFKAETIPTKDDGTGTQVPDYDKADFHVVISSSEVTALKTLVGDTTMTTDAKTITAAINELDAAIDLLNENDDTKAGTIKNSIKTAIDALDTTADVVIASKDAGTGKVTLKAGIKEEDGIIAQGTGADIELGTAANADVATVAIAKESADTNLVSAAQVAAFVKGEIAGLEGVLHFRGIITRQGAETDIQAIERVITDPASGDVVVMADNSKEYIFVDPDPETAGDEVWREVGDEGLYVKKSTRIAVAADGTGGVDLEDNITKDELLTALNVADGADVSTIKSVQVGGVDLTPDTDKKVNIEVASNAEIDAIFTK